MLAEAAHLPAAVAGDAVDPQEQGDDMDGLSKSDAVRAQRSDLWLAVT